MPFLAEPARPAETTSYPAADATSGTRQPALRPARAGRAIPAPRGAAVDRSPRRTALSDEGYGINGHDRAQADFPIPRRDPRPPDTRDNWPLRSTDPDHVDGYRLHARLGSGGTADVFAATGRGGRPVAIKVFRSSDRSIEVCRREFRLAYAVDPECTAPVVGYGVAAAGAYLVTDYLPGYRCGSTLGDPTVPIRGLWQLAGALAGTLAAIHARGVVHCDVKPSNLLIRGDDVRLIDFGIARYIGQPARTDGIIECSRGWAAPEQLTSTAVTPAVDVFAWGCLIAYLAGGAHPFASAGALEWMLRVQSSEPDLYGLPNDLAEVLLRTLARDPQLRPSAVDLAVICRQHDPATTGRTPTRSLPRDNRTRARDADVSRGMGHESAPPVKRR